MQSAVARLWERDPNVFEVLDILIATRRKDKKKYLLQDKTARPINQLFLSVDGVVEFLTGTGLAKLIQNREIKKTLTLGFSERIRDWQLDKNKSRYVEKVTEEQDYEIDRLLNSELNKIHSRENDIKGTQKITSRLRQLLTKKERVKEILDEKINSRIIAFSKNDNVKVPNCVMMVGPNPYIAKELAEWSALTTDSDFTVVDSSISNDKMQDNLMRALEESEENWQENHRRTIIFVEGMEKLLSPELNSAENIAGMKDMMQYADEDCRATIFFHSFDPKKLDSGTLAPHRVGVTVDVPITYSEAKIVKKGE
mgnify:CR=1 FL=1